MSIQKHTNQGQPDGLSIVNNAERVLIDDRPHIVFVFTQMWRWILIGLVAWGTMRWFGISLNKPILTKSANGALLIVAFRFVLGLIDWFARRHILTDSRIVAKFGILRTVTTDIPLRRVQHIVMVRPFAERLFGIGSLGITSAGTGSIDLIWRGIEHPQQVLDTIRAQVDRMSIHGEGKQVTPVIGIVGGIGAGKSTVTKVFEDLGCVVSDSDQSVREILSDRKVIRQLSEWWGKEILNTDGTIDRSKVADIVFEQPYERRRLEGLIHPLVHDRRRELIEAAIQDGAQGVIVDAPLLFEAGVDSECDAIVFVDTSHEIRLSRVQTTRGWDANELNMREKAQLGLEQKRKRSDYIVANNGLPDELIGRVTRVLASIRKDLAQRASNG
ncbi:MAG: dephospho-CoA kinase [Phycisphaerales bacterium]|nr:dephospho-CoA kinase [Phycisphaerales bacterium]